MTATNQNDQPYPSARHHKKKLRYIVAAALVLSFSQVAMAQFDPAAAQDLIQRVVPEYARHFEVAYLPTKNNRDTFEIESRRNKIILRGNNGVSVASALYYYVKEYANGQVTWNGENLKLGKLPKVPGIVRRSTPYEHRYYLNYCTFNYSMSWWDWERWEKEIDWMALHGINMPLAITAQEYVWNEVYRQMGFSEKELAGFFSGPAYFAWFWMGNLDGWGGPLPASWMQRQHDLQQKILRRQRALGMKPVLPAFTGHVPAALAKRFPSAQLKKTNWGNGFSDTYILDTEDPLFAEIGKRFLTLQTRLYGTDHFYSADTFNENEPPSNEPGYLAALSKRVFESMNTTDPKAVWVMQGWLFYSDSKFWQPAQIKALLDAVPSDRMLMLDLATEIEPVWKGTQAFYGKPWIWNMLHNFGGNVSLFGRMDGVAQGPASALNDSTSGKLSGIGLTMEGIEQNPVLYELMTEHTWRTDPIRPSDWLPRYIRQRYGSNDPHAINAWNTLHKTVYNGQAIRDGAESIIVARPTLESERRWAKTKLNYRAKDLLPAWNELCRATALCKDYEGFRYDLVDVTRQVLANYALEIHAQIVSAYTTKDTSALTLHSTRFIELMEDMDLLLATQQDFLLGRWLDQARSCGNSPEEKALYERNARNLITLWGDQTNRLHEYACRQWSGLISDFYKPRWEKFLARLQQSVKEGSALDQQAFDQSIRTWEWNWVNSTKDFPTKPAGDPTATAMSLHNKYAETITKAYQDN